MEEDIDLPLFDLATIVNATNGFSEDSLIGAGGFGPVYKVMSQIFQDKGSCKRSDHISQSDMSTLIAICRAIFSQDKKQQ